MSIWNFATGKYDGMPNIYFKNVEAVIIVSPNEISVKPKNADMESYESSISPLKLITEIANKIKGVEVAENKRSQQNQDTGIVKSIQNGWSFFKQKVIQATLTKQPDPKTFTLN